jgi:hypothetical protein
LNIYHDNPEITEKRKLRVMVAITACLLFMAFEEDGYEKPHCNKRGETGRAPEPDEGFGLYREFAARGIKKE